MKQPYLQKSALIGLAAVAAISLAGCGNSNETKKEPLAPSTETASAANASASPASSAPPVNTSASAAPSAAKKTQYPLTIKDATGKEFTFEKAPQRIVSVSPAETEGLFAIGLGDQIAGVSDFDDYPAEATTKPKMGGITKPNEEALIAANADIIFTGVSMKTDVVEKLRAMNLKVFKVEPKTLDDAIADVLTFGKITDHQEKAEEVAAKMNADRQRVEDAVKGVKPESKKKVYIEFSAGWTVGSGEFMDELIQIAGGVNTAGDVKGWHQISEEKVIQQNPNVILFSKGVVDDKSGKSLDQIIRGRSGWDQIDAIKNNRVVGIDQNLLSRPGPRMTDGLVAMAKAIYPELVK
ncbi:ABC transporter substrate-binding protein [Paenibacillus hexagrammi]|uniref:ABC transporter substrate-binding protein n=1 Tax=Paenibacillus hexagrammi TaxID=2908839 RepID=A0ABY3SN06_9BACL|nr:ABC transporter substrate-binding protein [Paenibacillus sp. YPD9-1]UJF34471.1 ABC transporter substrate-binding protein [Paenibacillus sp. YPD9-1]